MLRFSRNKKNKVVSRFRPKTFNFLTIGSLIVILVFALLAIFAYLIIPDKSPNANTQHLEIAALKPGKRVNFLKEKKENTAEGDQFLKALFVGRNENFNLIPYSDFFFRADSIVIREYSDFESDMFFKSYQIAELYFGIKSGEYTVDPKINEIFIHAEDVPRHYSFADIQSMIERENLVTRRFIFGTDRFGRDMFSRLV